MNKKEKQELLQSVNVPIDGSETVAVLDAMIYDKNRELIERSAEAEAKEAAISDIAIRSELGKGAADSANEALMLGMGDVSLKFFKVAQKLGGADQETMDALKEAIDALELEGEDDEEDDDDEKDTDLKNLPKAEASLQSVKQKVLEACEELTRLQKQIRASGKPITRFNKARRKLMFICNRMLR